MPAILALILAFTCITATLPAVAADPPAATVKQLDLAKKLIDTFGWSEGLPENPGEKDYLAILNGNRTFRFEAEEIYDRQSDAVSIRNYPLFGAFTGSGWIHGSSTPTAVHFRAFIPVSGTYTLLAAASGGEQLWSVAGRAFKVKFGESLKEGKIGQLFVPSGYLDFNTLIPPAAGLDYVIFTAPALAAIEPAAGWNFNAPLTAAALAETTAALLGSEQLLPDDGTYARKTVEASSSPLPAGVQLTETQIYGKPVSAKWVRATPVPLPLSIPVTVDKNGVYHIRMRCMGGDIVAGFGPRKITLPAKPYLDWVDFGTFRLQKGTHSLAVQLPPSGGIDLIEISRKLSNPADYLAISKLGIKEDAAIRPEELDRIMKLLQEQFKERK
jgi:hypothetical protein